MCYLENFPTYKLFSQWIWCLWCSRVQIICEIFGIYTVNIMMMLVIIIKCISSHIKRLQNNNKISIFVHMLNYILHISTPTRPFPFTHMYVQGSASSQQTCLLKLHYSQFFFVCLHSIIYYYYYCFDYALFAKRNTFRILSH